MAEPSDKQPEPTKADEHAPGWTLADWLHSLLPDAVSARAAVLRKRAELKKLDEQTKAE